MSGMKESLLIADTQKRRRTSHCTGRLDSILSMALPYVGACVASLAAGEFQRSARALERRTP